MKPIKFIGNGPCIGSVLYRGAHIATALREQGYDAEYLSLSREELLTLLSTQKDNIIVLLNRMSQEWKLVGSDLYDIYHEGNNILICDYVDKFSGMGYYTSEKLLANCMDGIILTNTWQQKNLCGKDKFILPFVHTTVIPHNYNPESSETIYKKDPDFSVCFVGGMYNNPFLQNPPSWLKVYGQFYGEEGWEAAKRSNCHFSHRLVGTEDFYNKPCTKLANAIGCRAAIIMSRDPSNLDIVQEDYPLYVDDSLSSIEMAYELAMSYWGTDRWQSKIMNHLNYARARLNPYMQATTDYIPFFQELGG